jgi:hypothetical protein
MGHQERNGNGRRRLNSDLALALEFPEARLPLLARDMVVSRVHAPTTVVAWVIFVSTALNSWQTERGPLGVL